MLLRAINKFKRGAGIKLYESEIGLSRQNHLFSRFMVLFPGAYKNTDGHTPDVQVVPCTPPSVYQCVNVACTAECFELSIK